MQQNKYNSSFAQTVQWNVCVLYMCLFVADGFSTHIYVFDERARV